MNKSDRLIIEYLQTIESGSIASTTLPQEYFEKWTLVLKTKNKDNYNYISGCGGGMGFTLGKYNAIMLTGEDQSATASLFNHTIEGIRTQGEFKYSFDATNEAENSKYHLQMQLLPAGNILPFTTLSVMDETGNFKKSLTWGLPDSLETNDLGELLFILESPESRSFFQEKSRVFTPNCDEL